MRSLAGAVFATIQDYPSIAAGSCAFMVAFALVAGNALLGQPGGHPGPLWATRDAVTTQSVPGPQVPVRKVRTETFAPVTIPVPELRPNAVSEAADPADLVSRTQQALAELGLYDGKVDGKYGPVTREAILNFQRANGLKPDGQVTSELFSALEDFAGGSPRSETAGRDDTRTNSTYPLAVRSDRPGRKDTKQDSIADLLNGDDGQQAQPAVTRVAELTPANDKPLTVSDADTGTVRNGETGIKVMQDSAEEIARSARIARIQIGLTNFGESGIAVDGVLGPDTAEAIRQFQQRYGLPTTGEPDAAVIRKLEQIGALQNS